MPMKPKGAACRAGDRFANAAILEVDRVRQRFSRAHFEELACGLTGVDEPRPEVLVFGGERGVGASATSRRAPTPPESLTDVPSR